MQHTSQQGITLELVNYWLYVSPRKGSSLAKGRALGQYSRSSCISMPLTCSLPSSYKYKA